MFAILLVFLLAGGAVETMHRSPLPCYVSPSLEEPHYRPGQGAGACRT